MSAGKDNFVKSIQFILALLLCAPVCALAQGDGISIPNPPVISVSGTDVTVTASDSISVGFRLHYNFHNGIYNDSIQLSAAAFTALPTPDLTHVILSSDPLVFDIEAGSTVAATAFNANGESSYSATATLPGTAQALSAARTLRNALLPNRGCRCAECGVRGIASEGHPRFSSSNHALIVNTALAGLGLDPTQLNSISTNDVGVDFTHLTDASYHFDDGTLAASAMNIRTILAQLDSLPDAQVAPAFGTALHIVQDFYAHTNFTENYLSTHPALTSASQFTSAMLTDLPNFQTQTDPNFYNAWVSGVWGGGFFENSLEGRHPTYAVPSSYPSGPCVTIFNDLETGEARPSGYRVGFVPWHGHLNKDTESTSGSPEGAAIMLNRTDTLNQFAIRFAVVHTQGIYNSLSAHVKSVLASALVPQTLTGALQGLLSNPGTGLNIIPAPSTDTSALSVVVSLNLNAVTSLGGGYSTSPTGTVSVFSDAFGSFNAPIIGSLKFKNGSGKLKMSGLGLLYFPNRLSQSAAGTISLTGTVTDGGTFVGKLSVKTKKLKFNNVPAQHFTEVWQSQLLQ